jgi:LPS export ABC transporter protein LptC
MISGSSSEDLNDPVNAGSGRNFALNYKAISVILLVLIIISCENDIEVIKSFSQNTLMPRQSMIDAEIIYTDSGRVQLMITAPEIHYFNETSEQYTEFPYGVFTEFFDRDENVESQLSSKYAIYYTDKELWEAKDSVVVINQAGEILNTEQLFWDERNKIIYSNSFVKVTRPDEVIMGEGFEADETFSRWKIKKIQGTIYIHDEQ